MLEPILTKRELALSKELTHALDFLARAQAILQAHNLEPVELHNDIASAATAYSWWMEVPQEVNA